MISHEHTLVQIHPRPSVREPASLSLGSVDGQYCLFLVDTGKNGGQVAVDEDGSLSVKDHGDEFKMVFDKTLFDRNHSPVQIFSLHCRKSQHDYILAYSSNDNYSVRGMTLNQIGSNSHHNSYWRMIKLCEIAGTSCNSTHNNFALQYYGDEFGPPDPDSTDGYYFVIKDLPSDPKFCIREKSEAVDFGAFAFSHS